MRTQNILFTARRPIKGRHPNSGGFVFIYNFEGKHKINEQLLGGKGAVLAEMTRIGLPVPPGFTITTETCDYYLKNKSLPRSFHDDLKNHIHRLEKQTGKQFGGAKNPLLVSVRSGAAISMPGMMDTVLNLGLNDETIQGLILKTGDERFCWDAYQRFVCMFGEVVLDIPHELFEHALQKLKGKNKITEDIQLKSAELKKLVIIYKEIVAAESKKIFPEDPQDQLREAIMAVFRSWESKRAIAYRRINKITGLLGTAVNVQSMVFGNKGNTSGTGVAFTRNPSTGAREFYGEFLINAQGEDVVAGIRTPKHITELKKIMPEVYMELHNIQDILERHYKNMQDIEFTVEEGRLFILQSRNGKGTAKAALKIAIDMVKEGLITKNEALLQVDPLQLNQLLHPTLPATHKGLVLCKGLPASPGAAVGRVVFSQEKACEWSENGEKVILVRKETSPEDIQGMFAAQGILTSTGGMTSHAAVVCRGMGKPCVAGCASIQVDHKNSTFTCNGKVIKMGDTITLNGATGEVLLGTTSLCEPQLGKEFKVFMRWADTVRTMKVRTNADTPADVLVARDFGAEGIGLCRTEHMFFQEDRIPKIREMILANDEAGRRRALAKLRPLQQKDFEEIFKAMAGYPVTIRLLDPPLHEFMPTTKKQLDAVSKAIGVSKEMLKKSAQMLHEINPMLGHRGCRLAVTYPEIYEMQVEAIVEAAIAVTRKRIKVAPEIEIPFINTGTELKAMRQLVEGVLDRYKGLLGFTVKIGTMIELPRACLTADEIAPFADFFSFGTNDLTQMTFGISRDDAGKFLPQYLENKLLAQDPTETIDQKGVGQLMELCVKLGRSVKPKLEIGICGEHGGEPLSVEFCHQIGINYVSCSPYRVPLARLAAAQAVLQK